MILAIAIVTLCLSSVSAVEDNDVNSTLETVNDNSQDENIVINELKSADDTSQDVSNVSTENEKELLKASDEDVLEADSPGQTYIWDHDTPNRPEPPGSWSMVTVADQTITTYVEGDTITIDAFVGNYNGYIWTLKNLNTGATLDSKTNNGFYSWTDSLFSYTFPSAGTYILQINYQGSSNNYISNKLTYVVERNVPSSSLEIYNPDNAEKNKFVFANQDSVDFTIENILYSNDFSTISDLQAAVGSSTISVYINGVFNTNVAVGYTGNPSSKTFTLNRGKNVIQYEFTGNDDVQGSSSNKITVWVGEEPEEYSTILILNDKTLTPDANGIYYIPITTSTNIFAEIYNASLGSNIKNYILTENDEVSEYASLYYDYLKLQDLVLSPNGEGSVGQTMTFVNVESLDLYLVYEGNERGLLPSMSEILKYRVYAESSKTTVNVNPSSNVGIGGNVIITPSVTYDTYYYDNGWRSTTAIVDFGFVDIYDGSNLLGTVAAGESFETSFQTSGSHTINAVYRGYNITEDGSVYNLLPSSSGSASLTVSSNSNSMTLTANGESELLVITPGTSVTFVSNAVTSSDYDYLYIYLNGERFDYSYYYSKKSTTITFDESDLGDNEVYTYYDGSSYNNRAATSSNKVIVRVMYSESDTETTVTVKPAQTDLGNFVTITPTVKSGTNQINDGEVTLYINDAKIAVLSPGDQYNYVPSEYGTYNITCTYEGGTSGEHTYKTSSGQATFLVKKEEEEIIAGSLTITVTNTTYGNTKATITVSQAGNYTISINGNVYGETYEFSDAGSQSNIAITGYAASTIEYTATITHVESGNTNSTIFTISQADANLQVSLAGNNTLLSDTQTLTVTANGNGKVKINNGAEKDLGPITLDSLVAGMNTVTVDYTGDENYTSASKTIYVYVYDKYPSSVSLEVNATGIAKGDSVKVTPTVTVNDNAVTSGRVSLYYSNNTLIDTIDLGQISYFVFTPLGDGGDTVSIYAKYLENTDLSYAESPNSDSKSVKIKRHLTINLTVDGETSFIGQVATRQFVSGVGYMYLPQYLFYANASGVSLPVKVYDNNLEVSGTFATDSDDIELYFTSSETGDHVVYVEFEGDDEYLPARSNDVTFHIYNTGSPSGSLSFDPTNPYPVEGDTVTVSVTVKDQSRYISGTYTYPTLTKGNVTLYYDSQRTQEIGTVNLGETLDFSVPAIGGSYSYGTVYVYARYNGAVEDDYMYGEYDFSGSFTALKKNNLNITGNDQKDTVNIYFGQSVTLKVDIDYWNYRSAYDSNWNTVYYSDIAIYLDGKEFDNFTVEQTSSGYSYTYTISDYIIEFADDGNLGNHSIYAAYKGSQTNGAYYAPAISNTLTINVTNPTTLQLNKDKTTDYYIGQTVTITPTVTNRNGAAVTSGNVTYKEGENVLASELDVNTPFTTSTLTPGTHTITAVYNGNSGYDASNVATITFEVRPLSGFTITVTNVTYGEADPVATVSVSQAGTYILKIDGVQYGDALTFTEAGSQQITLTGFKAHDNYNATVWLDDISNYTLFNISRATPTLDITVVGNETLTGDNHLISVSSQGTGTVSTNCSVGDYALNSDISLSLSAGLNAVNVTYSGDENYTSASKTVYIRVYDKYPSTISIILNASNVVKGESIKITPTVTVNNNQVGVGTVIFYDENNNEIGSIDLSQDDYLEYVVNAAEGTAHSVYAVYQANATVNQSTSRAEQYNVKKNLTIVLVKTTADPITSGYIYFTINYSDSVSDNLTFMNGEIVIGSEDGTNKTWATSSDYSKGHNDFYIKFAGNDEYAPCESNHVDVIVYEQVYVNPTISFNVTHVVEGQNVLITVNATYRDSNYNNVQAPGNVSVYNDYDLTSYNTTLGVGKSQELTIPQTEGTGSSYSKTLYVKYDDYTDSDNFVIYKHSTRGYSSVIIMRQNSMPLTVNGQDSYVEVDATEDLTLIVNPQYYYRGYDYSTGKYLSNVVIYVDDVIAGEFNLTNDYTPVLTQAKIRIKDLGEHTVYAYYKGYNASDAYYSSYAPAVSNAVKVNVTKNTTITIQTQDMSVYTGNPVNITYNVVDSEGKSVSAGNITFKDQNNNIIGHVNVGQEVSLMLSTGRYNITATYTGVGGYKNSVSNIIENVIVKPAAGFTIRVNNVVYGTNSTATVSVSQAGTYSISIDGIEAVKTLTFSGDESVKEIDLGLLNARDMYHAVISFDGYSNETYFNVSKNQVPITFNDYLTDPLYGESNNISANVTGYNITGTFTFSENSNTLASDVAIGGSFNTESLTAGIHTISVTYSGDDNYNTTSAEITVNVLSELPTEILLDINETSISAGQAIKLNVNVSNRNGEITEGNVEFYWANNDTLIGTIALPAKEFIFIPELPGSTYEVYARYVKPDQSAYAGNISSNKSFIVRAKLNIIITVNDNEKEANITATGILSKTDVTITSDCGDLKPELTVYLDGIETTVKINEGTTSTTGIGFTTSDFGNHTVYVKFAGNEYYEESASNNVTINVFKTQAVRPSISFNASKFMEGETVLITIGTGSAPVNVTLYTDSQHLNKLTSLNSTNTFEYVIPKTSVSESSYKQYIYVSYDGATQDYVHYVEESYANVYGVFNVLKQNNMNLTVNDENTTVSVDYGSELTIKAVLDYYRAVYQNYAYASNITIYMDSDDNIIGTFTAADAVSINDFTLTLNDEKYLGLHRIYAVYGGSSYEQDYYTTIYYAPSESNYVTVNVTKTTKLNLTSNDTSIYVGNTVTVKHNVTDDDNNPVSLGNVTYTDENGHVWASEVPLSQDAVITGMDVGTYTITATYNGADGYKTSVKTIKITIKPTAGFNITVPGKTYPENVTATVKVAQAGEYTIKVDGITVKTVTFAEGEYLKQIDLGRFNAHDNYIATVEFDGFSNQTSFNVSKGKADLIIGQFNSTPLIEDENPINVNVSAYNATGSITFAEGTTIWDVISINGTYNANNLTAGPHTITVTYSGDDNYNSTSAEITVNVLGELPTEILLDINETSISAGQAIKLNVSVSNERGSIEKGTVEFYWKNNDTLIGSIDLPAREFIFTPALDAGTYEIYAKYVQNTQFRYAEANSTVKSFKVKANITIELTRTGSGLLKPGDTVYFTITNDAGVELDLMNNNTGYLWTENGDPSTWINLDESDIGTHEIYLRFNGTEDYNPCESNRVTIEVVKPIETIIIVEVNATEAVPGSKLNVSAKVFEKETRILVSTGTISFKDYIYGSDIKTINIGEEYIYTTDANAYPSTTPSFIYATYNGGSTEDKIYAASENKTQYYLVYANALTLTVNDTDSITVYEDQSIELLAALHGGSDAIVLYVNAAANETIVKNTKTEFILPVGQYTIIANYTRANDVYASCVSEPITVTVLPSKATVIQLNSNSPVIYNNEVEITANVTCDGVQVSDGKIKYYINGVENETLNVGEKLTFKATSMEGYSVNATYLGTVEYETSNSEIINVAVNKADNHIKVEVETASYPEAVTVNLTADIAGNYTVDINSTQVTVEVTSDGATGSNTTVLTPGTYYANVTGYTSDYYNPICDNDEFTVTMKDNIITVTVDDGVKYGQSATVHVKASVAGNYTVILNGTSVTVEVKTNGAEGQNTTEILSRVGTYYANVTTTIPYYKNIVQNTTFNVAKADNTAVINIAENNYLPGNITVQVKGGVKGIYVVSFGEGKSVEVEVTPDNGLGEASYHLDAGENYNATLTLDNENYQTTAEPVTFNVRKSNVTLSITVPQVLNGNAVKGTVTTDVAGTYTIAIDGYAPFTQDLTVGANSFTTDYVPALASEAYNVTVSIAETSDYNAKSANTTFNVVHDEVTFTVAPLKDTYVYGEEVILNVTITEGATGKVTFTYANGTPAGQISNVSTNRQLSLGILNAGSYNLSAVYEGNTQFAGKTYENIVFTVKKADNNVVITIRDTPYGESITLNVTADVDAIYQVNISGQIVNVDVKDKKGTNTTYLNLAADHYTATTDFTDDNYNTAITDASFNVTKIENTITVIVDNTVLPSDVTVKVKANVSGVYNVTIGTNSVNVKVGDNGEGSASIKLPAGENYIATTSFADSENYTVTVKDALFNVSKGVNNIKVVVDSVTYPNEVTVKVVADVAGTYKVDVNGTVLDVEANSTGVNYKFTAGNYVAKVVGYSSEVYGANIADGEFIVSPAENTIVVIVDNTVLPSDVTVKVKANVSGVYNVTIGTNSVNVKVGDNGEGSASIKLPAGENYIATTSFADSENYTVTVKDALFNVSKGVNNIKVVVDSVTYPNEVTVKVVADVAGTYKVDVNGTVLDVEANSTGVNYKFAAGNYVAKVVDYSSEVYEANIADGEFTVSPAENTIVVIVDNTVLPSDVTVKVKVNVSGVYNVTIGSYSVNVKVGDNGEGSASIKLPTGDNYKATTSFADSENYTVTVKDALFNVSKGVNNIKVVVDSVTYPNEVTVKVVADVAGTYKVDVNGTVLDVKANSTGVNYKFAAGNYTAKVVDYSSDVYEANIVPAAFEVKKATNNIVVKIDSVEYGDNITVTVEADVADVYTVNINGHDVTVNVTGTSSSTSVKLDLGVDKYAGTTSWENANYTVNIKNAEFNVTAKTNNVLITVNNTSYGDNITVKVAADVDGTYAVNINGNVVIVEVNQGSGSNTTSLGLDAGSYQADASFDNANYTTVVSKANFNITKAVNSIVISVDDVTLPDNVTVKVTADVDGTYIISINATPVTVVVSNGNGENTTSLKAGSYLANTTFDDGNYEVKITAEEFNVNKVSEYEMNVSVNDTKITVNVPEDASGIVSAKIGNETFTAKIENGTAVIDVSDIPEGNSTAEITYEGDDKYEGKNTTKTVVKKHIPTIISGDMTRGYNSGMDFNATFKDAKGNPLSNTQGAFKVGDKTYNVTTDADGVAKLNEKLAVGKYTVTSLNLVTGECASNNLTVTGRIANNKDLVMDYRDGSKFKVQVIGDDGKIVGAGETVVFKVNGVEYNMKTDAKGIASITIRLVPKTYTITSTYKGFTVKNKITVKQILKSKNVKVKKSAKKLTLKATIKWSNGKAIKGKKITFKFKGKTYKAKTNKKGIAKVVIKKKVIKKLKAGKKYKFRVKYIDDTITKKVTVKK